MIADLGLKKVKSISSIKAGINIIDGKIVNLGVLETHRLK